MQPGNTPSARLSRLEPQAARRNITGEQVHADEQIDVQETETEADIDLELDAPSADPAAGPQQTIGSEDRPVLAPCFS